MTDTLLNKRLPGLDLARFIAFVGMVIVNFQIVMVTEVPATGLLAGVTQSLQGRAAASFVVLAGIGLGLAFVRNNQHRTLLPTLKRAAFLLAIGLANMLVFDADIIHYYAFYFLVAVFFLPLSTRAIITGILAVNIIFMALIFTLDYNTGWNWTTYAYADFWTPVGFVRNLFFNGWHPVFPWLAFFLFGILLSRLPLGESATQNRLIMFGVAAVIATEALSAGLIYAVAGGDADLAVLLATSPVPPAPLYILTGFGIAAALTGFCLKISATLEKYRLLQLFTPAGRQTLTLYIAHIFIGMGTLETFSLLGGQSLELAVGAALAFCLAALIYAWMWQKWFKRGPLEALMRMIAG